MPKRDHNKDTAKRQQPAARTAAVASRLCADNIGEVPERLDDEVEALLAPPEEKLPTLPNGTSYRFDPDVAREVLWRVSQGETVASICKDEHLPNELAIWYWERQFAPFAKAMSIARARQGEAWGELAVSQSMQDPYEGLDPAERDSHSIAKVRTMAARVRGDILIRAAGRRDPERWGDRPAPGAGLQVVINTNLSVDQPLNAGHLVATAVKDESDQDK